jgi:hypothetical protein
MTLGQVGVLTTWLAAVLVAGVVSAPAYADALVVSPTRTGDLLIGFVVLPVVLGAVGGVVIPHLFHLVGEAAAYGASAALVFATSLMLRIDLSPGSIACPEGCEEDIGYGAVGAWFLTFIPFAVGFISGQLARRMLRRTESAPN